MSIKHLAFGAVALFGLLLASPVSAGVGVGVAPDFPATVVVGQSGISVGLEITNNSTPDVGSVTLSNIRLIPQCGDTDADSTTCVAAEADPGVFAVGAVGTGANACVGTSFTIAVNDAVTGQVLLTPNAPISLALGATCRINFSVDVVTSPTKDAIAAAGMQTLQIGKVTADTATLSGTGVGTDITTVSKVSPTVSTLLSTTSAAVGTAVTDSATLSGATATASGTASYMVFSDTGCSAGAQSAGTVAVTNATVPNSNPITFNTPGTFYWQVVYSGDANNNAATSTCTEEVVTITQPMGRIIVDKVTNPAGDPQSFGFTATGTGYTSFSLTDAAAPNDQALTPGTYGVSETVPVGWVQGTTTCSSSLGGNENPASIGLTAGEVVTCTFNNTKNGRLIVDKVTNPGGSTVVFPIKATGTGAITGTGSSTITDALNAEFEVAPGTYTVTEIVPGGWNQTSNTCNGVAVAAGATVTCTITNTQQVAQYCSPGYWKQPQHFDNWVGYLPTQKFSAVFGETITIMWSSKGKPAPVTDPTLQQALEANGSGINLLARATVDALLNAAKLSSGLTTTQVIDMFNAAYPGTNEQYQTLSSQFTAPENCPLN
jgi:hypothetical protein